MNIRHKLLLAAMASTAIGITPLLYVVSLSVFTKVVIVLLTLGLNGLCFYFLTTSINKSLQALEVGLLNFKDGEYSSTLACHSDDEFGALCALFNATADTLRAEKQWLHQRELMLDKVLQTSPDVLLLVDSDNRIVFSNYQARHFFNASHRLEGDSLDILLKDKPTALGEMMQDSKEGLFTLPIEDKGVETWHIAKGTFLLNNHPHRLFILKQMTRELNRQEVTVWKKVIRVISHELNNSLGPISSLLHSGKIVGNQNGDPRLVRVFKTIEERIDHLNQFVQGYGKFAKLPAPVFDIVNWNDVLAQLKQQFTFKLSMSEHIELRADSVQLEQLLINLLKNAHESGGDAQCVELAIYQNTTQVIIEVLDNGKGMSESVMANALVPFYSTKATGSGLGLALCREITDAHRGHLIIQNRQEKGLCVRVVFEKN
ncbi:sensor histidine kinase [Alteromonas gracilis]|uniref:sensor histidine kinase n=1 Tax=Alteromonas gracilis TaxID=1479524 RepID=UPI0030CEFE09